MPLALVLDPFGLGAYLTKAYDENEPRDDHGRWTSGGASDSTASRLISAGIAGGFTWHPATNTNPSTGFAVAVQGHNVEIPFTDGRRADQRAAVKSAIREFLRTNATLFKSNPALHLGGWRDKAHGEFVLDISEVVHDQATAISLGQERNQQAIFDLHNLEEIPTGGTGDREVHKQADPGPAARVDPGRSGFPGSGPVDRGLPERRPGPDRVSHGLSFDPFGIREAVEKWNPYHKGPGEGGGQFTTADDAGGGQLKFPMYGMRVGPANLATPSAPKLTMGASHNTTNTPVYPKNMAWYAQTLAGHSGESYKYQQNLNLLRDHGQEGKILAAGISNWTGSSTSLKEAGFAALQNPGAPISGASPEIPQELKNWEGASFGQGVVEGYGFTDDQMKSWGFTPSPNAMAGTVWSKEDRPIDNIYDGQARTMMQAAADGPLTTEDLYRGRGINTGTPEGAADLARYTTVGNTFDYSLVSYSGSKSTAESFASGKGDTALVLHVEPGANGLDISGASSFDSEKETILSGRFQVTDVQKEGDDFERTIYNVTLTPLGPPGVGEDFHAGDVAGAAGAHNDLKNEDGGYKIFDGVGPNGWPAVSTGDNTSFTPKDLPSEAFMSSAEVNKLPEEQSQLALPTLKGDNWYLPTSPKDLADYGQIPAVATSYAEKQGWTNEQMTAAGYVQNPKDNFQWLVPATNSYPMGDAPVPDSTPNYGVPNASLTSSLDLHQYGLGTTVSVKEMNNYMVNNNVPGLVADYGWKLNGNVWEKVTWAGMKAAKS